MRASIVGPLALCSSLAACAVTNTGNPNTDAPKGTELVRSELQRETTPALSADERDRFGADNRQFAFALYAQVKDESPNLLFSPYSISVALAMTYAGAEGETEQEMASALHFGLPEPSLHAAFNAADLALQGRGEELAESASNRDRFELRMTNASFAQRGRWFEPDYLDVLAQHYGAGMFLADFASDPERERKAINDWVLERTEQRVQELLPMNSIDELTALVLVNTVYFKASWLEKFNPNYTQQATFHAPSGDVTVQMMRGTAEGYARLSNYRAISLPYIAPAVRMLVILPDEGQLDAVEGRLDDTLFQEARAALTSNGANVQLPRFSFDSEIRLNGALETLGMVQAFGEADLSGMSGPPGDLYISGVYHKAFVAVDEQGTEAGAATAVVVSGRSVPPPPEFIADRPFIFVLYDDPTGQILFVGRLTEPEG